MGAAVGEVLKRGGHNVLCATHGRSSQTADRARQHGLVDVRTIPDLLVRSAIVLSICPPHAAREVAEACAGFGGIFVDANAVSPATAREIGAEFEHFVDGGIIGPVPTKPGLTRLYLSGAEAPAVAAVFSGTALEARIVSEEPGGASALKMAYAAWTKGTAALVLACRGLAHAEGIEGALLREWSESQPGLSERCAAAASLANANGPRWAGEMDEISASFERAGLFPGFHRAAADFYRRFPHGDGDPLDRFLALHPPRSEPMPPVEPR
jgi:3-hydroxyisobutyrate dehydrogenase-like beta-hydroxyacid dehydrogenase